MISMLKGLLIFCFIANSTSWLIPLRLCGIIHDSSTRHSSFWKNEHPRHFLWKKPSNLQPRKYGNQMKKCGEQNKSNTWSRVTSLPDFACTKVYWHHYNKHIRNPSSNWELKLQRNKTPKPFWISQWGPHAAHHPPLMVVLSFLLCVVLATNSFPLLLGVSLWPSGFRCHKFLLQAKKTRCDGAEFFRSIFTHNIFFHFSTSCHAYFVGEKRIY